MEIGDIHTSDRDIQITLLSTHTNGMYIDNTGTLTHATESNTYTIEKITDTLDSDTYIYNTKQSQHY